MARAGIPHPRSALGISRRRWALHAAVLLLAFGAVLYAVLAGDRDPRRPAPQDPPPADPRPAAAAPLSTPAPAPSPTPSPAPSPSASPSPEPSPEPTPAPPATPEPSPAPSPTPEPPRPTPVPPPPPVATPRPAVTARTLDTATLRTSPSQEAVIAGYLPAGSSVTVVACAAGCAWLQVVTPSGTLWSARYFWTVTGDLSGFGGR